MDGRKCEAGDLSQVYGHKTVAKCKTRWIIGSLFLSSATQPILHRHWQKLDRRFLWSMQGLKSIGCLEPAGFFFFIGASMSKYEMIAKKTRGQLDKDQHDQRFDCYQGQELV